MATTKKTPKIKRARTHLFTMRMTEEEFERCQRVAEAREASIAFVIRDLIRREHLALVGSKKP